MKQSETYPFCNICPLIENPTPQEVAARLFEGDYWRATLRLGNQALLGTAYVTLKEHKAGVEDLNESEENEFSIIRNGLIIATRKAFGASIPNVAFLMNYAFRDTGQKGFTPQPHVHAHLKPRYDGPRTVGDEIFTDPEFGSYLRQERSHVVSPATGALITTALHEELRRLGIYDLYPLPDYSAPQQLG